jgi:hypothetical protein
MRPDNKQHRRRTYLLNKALSSQTIASFPPRSLDPLHLTTSPPPVPQTPTSSISTDIRSNHIHRTPNHRALCLILQIRRTHIRSLSQATVAHKIQVNNVAILYPISKAQDMEVKVGTHHNKGIKTVRGEDPTPDCGPAM